MPKVLVLILSTRDSRYANFIKSCKDTWVLQAKEHLIPCIFYEGSADHDQLDGCDLRLAADDALAGTGHKLIRALRYIEDSSIEYDYIFRTNLSSYIFINNFIGWINNIEDGELYAGSVNEFNMNDCRHNKYLRKFFNFIYPRNKILFAEGAGFWISKGNIQKVLSDKALNFNLVDDVMVGESLYRQNVFPTSIPRIDYISDGSLTATRLSGGLEEMEDCYHVRIKSSDRAFDAAFFYKLHQHPNFAQFYMDCMYRA